jgi:hypothetical protein
MLYLPLNRPSAADGGGSRESPALDPSVAASRLGRRPPQTPDVIVIEDNDEESDQEPTRVQDQPAPAPNMAPPDPVLDEVDERSSTQHEPADDPMEGEANATTTVEAIEKRVPHGATVANLRTGAFLYACFGGAPSLALEWTKYFTAQRTSDIVDAADTLQFLQRYPAVASYPTLLAQFVVKAFRVQLETLDSQASGEDTPTLASLDAASVVNEFASVVSTLQSDWTKCMVGLVSHALQQHGTRQDTSSNLVGLTRPPTLAPNPNRETEFAFLKAHSAWSESQAQALLPLVRYAKERGGGGGSSAVWTAIDHAQPSPGLLVFLWWFDIVEVVAGNCLEGARFRLNKCGRQMLGKLWERSLNKLPLPLFIECAWLDDQSAACKRIPVLGLAHVITTVLLWFTTHTQQLPTAKLVSLIEYTVRVLTAAIRVDGKSLSEISNSSSTMPLVVLGETSTTQSLEVEFASLEWAQLLDLTGYDEVVNTLGKA